MTLLWGLARGRGAAAVAIEMACRYSRLYRVLAIVVDGALDVVIGSTRELSASRIEELHRVCFDQFSTRASTRD